MSFLIPTQRLHETPHWVAFLHPKPSYPVHILIVTKDGISSFQEYPAGGDERNRELVEMVQQLVNEHDLEPAGYRLIVNGGSNQDVPVLHFHLISDARKP